jgi:hypothetical protein
MINLCQQMGHISLFLDDRAFEQLEYVRLESIHLGCDVPSKMALNKAIKIF